MHANTVRIATMGKYAMIPGIRFSRHPELGTRDVLAETIAAAKPRGIRVVPYISTGHKLAWSMVTTDHPEYAQRTRPGGGPARSHMFVGEDHGTVCWSTPYREAYLEYVEQVVRDYDVDGLYFDTWRPHYFWPGLKSYRSMMGGPNDLYLASRTTGDSSLVPLWHFEPVDVLDGGGVTFDIVTGDGSRRLLPGAVTSRHGRGRVVYLASSLESLYSSTRQSDIGHFLRARLAWAAGTPPPVQVTGPALLVANLTQNGSRQVLHLLNWNGESESEGGYLPPVENVTVRWTIPEGRNVRRVSPLIDAPCQHDVSGRILTLTLPRIEAYQAIAVEYW